MSKISKINLAKEIKRFIWQRLLEVFREAKSDAEVDEILDDLLTASEKIIFSKRLAISFLLDKGLSYVQIMDILKVSSGTIKSVKNSMRRRGVGYERIVRSKNLSKLDKVLQRVLEELDYGFKHAGKMLEYIPTKSGPGRWRFLDKL